MVLLHLTFTTLLDQVNSRLSDTVKGEWHGGTVLLALNLTLTTLLVRFVPNYLSLLGEWHGGTLGPPFHLHYSAGSGESQTI